MLQDMPLTTKAHYAHNHTQLAHDAALQRGAKLGMKEWVLPREQMELGATCVLTQ